MAQETEEEAVIRKYIQRWELPTDVMRTTLEKMASNKKYSQELQTAIQERLSTLTAMGV